MDKVRSPLHHHTYSFIQFNVDLSITATQTTTQKTTRNKHLLQINEGQHHKLGIWVSIHAHFKPQLISQPNAFKLCGYDSLVMTCVKLRTRQSKSN